MFRRFFRRGAQSEVRLWREAVLEVIKEAAQNGSEELDLANESMEHLPGEIGQLANRRALTSLVIN